MNMKRGSVLGPENKNRRILLNDGNTMPIIGLGMFLLKDEAEVDKSIRVALEAGYRHFDTAFGYRNEAVMGKTFQKAIDGKRLKREDVFITGKLPSNGHAPQNVDYFFKKSLGDLRLEYLDLYLIHFPVASKRTEDDYASFSVTDGSFDGDPTVDLLDTWKELENLVDEGLVKSIGLSNFNSEQIKRIYDNARIKPAVLQVECHAYLAQFELHELCKDLKIALTAYGPLGAPGSKGGDQPLIQDPLLQPFCQKYGKSPAQVLLRYLVQRDIIVIPKSSNPTRIQENIQIFDFKLSDEDMETLKSMNRDLRYFKFDSVKGIKEQREFPF